MAGRRRDKKAPLDLSEPRSLRQRQVPHGFVLDAIAELEPTTKTMFGALAVYVDDRIVFLLRGSLKDVHANGVWVAVPVEHQESLRPRFPNALPVRIMGKDIRNWWVLSPDQPDFEESVVSACELVVRRDPRVGRVPNSK